MLEKTRITQKKIYFPPSALGPGLLPWPKAASERNLRYYRKPSLGVDRTTVASSKGTHQDNLDFLLPEIGGDECGT
ncbi:hypothetical protein GBA52_015170 [Prunus armeniaca]|nr:hypothetical protein GBA52_015170 [Prunus armeniaca]